MKKKWAIICALILACLALNGCAEPETETQSPEQPEFVYREEGWRTKVPGEYLIGDYESDLECANIVLQSTRFGKLSLSETNASLNDRSLKIEVYGTGNLYMDTLEIPAFKIGTTADTADAERNKHINLETDYSEYDAVKFDLFSEMDCDTYIQFCVNDIRFNVNIRIEPGLNRIEIPLDSGLSADIYGNQNDLSLVYWFMFRFQRYEVYNQVQTYYLDNLRFVKNNTET